MPRQARLDAPGTMHHVMVREIEKRKMVDEELRLDCSYGQAPASDDSLPADPEYSADAHLFWFEERGGVERSLGVGMYFISESGSLDMATISTLRMVTLGLETNTPGTFFLPHRTDSLALPPSTTPVKPARPQSKTVKLPRPSMMRLLRKIERL